MEFPALHFGIDIKGLQDEILATIINNASLLNKKIYYWIMILGI
jgi:hypothetical protein